MAPPIRLDLDFSLVLEENLPGGEGISPASRREALAEASSAAAKVRALCAKGVVGFPRLPFEEAEAASIESLARKTAKRFRSLLVLGIGGSALGTKAVLEGTGENPRGKGMKVHVADNVDPDSYFPLLSSLDPGETFVTAISKSGGTAETNAQLSIAAAWLRKAVGERWKEHVLLVTDPEKGVFRRMADGEGIASLPVPPDVGGRFSVLSAVGLFPLACAGLSPARLLAGARWMETIHAGTKGADNPVLLASAVYLHYFLRDRKAAQVWFGYGAGLDRVAEWWQQLWGESLGKARPDGSRTGQTPLRATGVTDQHSQLQLYQDGPCDKIYTFLRWAAPKEKGKVPRASFSPDMAMLGGRPLGDLFEAEYDGTSGALWKAGHPVVRITLGGRDEEHLGALFQLFEWVTAIVGTASGVDPFDQPGVEEGKRIAKALMGDPSSRPLRDDFLRRMERRKRLEFRLSDREEKGPGEGK
jgi:glucose-6-phosphate isomerase